MALGCRSLIRMARGDVEGSLADQALGLERSRVARDPQVVAPALAFSVWVLVETGHLAEARALADELLSAGHHSFELAIEPLMWAGEALGLTDRMRVALAAVRGGPWRDAAEAVLVGDFESAARVLDEIGAAPHAALARLRAARALIDAGRRAEGDVQLQRALTFWRSVGATRYVREGEALLAASA